MQSSSRSAQRKADPLLFACCRHMLQAGICRQCRAEPVLGVRRIDLLCSPPAYRRKDGSRKIDVEVLCCVQNHSRLRFAAAAFTPVGAQCLFRVVRAETNSGNWSPRLRKDAAHPVGECMKVCFSVIASSDTGLIGDDDQQKPASVSI